MCLLRRMTEVSEGLALEAKAFATKSTVVEIWTAQDRAIVCPGSLRKREGFDEAAARSAARGWPVHLRPSGGGAVPQRPGIVNLALCFTAGTQFSIEDGYRLITDVITAALKTTDAQLIAGTTPNSFCDGKWNLSLDGRKVVGTAQRIRPLGGGSRRILAHALILLEGDIQTGARAVDGLHADLDLTPILSEAHTTLSETLHQAAPDAQELARTLYTAAIPALHETGLPGTDASEPSGLKLPSGGGRHTNREETHV